ncbi:MAG: DUF4410 domain-containing protein [Terriglobales bacterium]
MKSNKLNLCICLAVIVAVAVASPREMAGQSASEKSSVASSSYAPQWSVQIDRVEPGEVQLAYSFQAAIYESLLEELNKTHQFKHVFREGDRKAGDAPNLLVLKATVVKYTPGSETRRAVTTFSGATKLSVRIQLVTREGKIVLDHPVNGSVRFFGSNLRATHNLARNIAKAIRQSEWLGSERMARYSPVNSECGRHTSPGL